MHIVQETQIPFHYQQSDGLNGCRADYSRKYRPERERAVVIPGDYRGSGEHEQIAHVGTFRRFYAFEFCHKINLSFCLFFSWQKFCIARRGGA